MPLDYTQPVVQVRLLTSDVGGNSGTSFIFEDAEVQAFLDLNGQNVRYAAALALRTMAANEAMVSKAIEYLDLKTNGPAVAEGLRKLAVDLEAQADADVPFEIANMDTDFFAERVMRFGDLP